MNELGPIKELALASRLKMLSESMYNDVDKAYANQGVAFQSRWFPVVMSLHNAQAAMSIGELAKIIGQSHASVSQISKQLLQEGWIEASSDPRDERRRLVQLSSKGTQQIPELQGIWTSIRLAIGDLFQQIDCDILKVLDALEQHTQTKSLAERIGEKHREAELQGIQVIPYQTEYSQWFRKLNEEWLQKYFYIEACDAEVLAHPEKIIQDGGHILFAKSADQIVGTCALMPSSDGRFELTKMAVTESYRGRGVGKKLLESALQAYKKSAAQGLFLYSNSKLKPALKLYEKYGFNHAKTIESSAYQRADVYMVLGDA